MRCWLKQVAICEAILVATLGLSGSAARAQAPCLTPPPCCTPPKANTDCPTAPIYQFPPMAEGIGQPGQVAPPGSMDQGTGTGELASLPPLTGGAGIGSSAELDPGYIDLAAPRTQVRIRFDAMYGDNRPDRADFFYPKCGCFQALGQRDAHGPPLPETNVDAQELMFYGEYAFGERFSSFVEIPIRYINPDVNANASGLSDVNFGFKYAMLYSPERILTFQLRATAPSGEPTLGLGTNNWWLEPAFLFEKQLSPRMALLGEFRDSIPVAPTDDFAGNVLRYGIGVSYMVYSGCHVRVTPITELVGWTVLSGKEFSTDLPGSGVKSAAGDTIVNAKFGVRFNFGDQSDGGTFLSHSDFYVGYGRALTGDVWYKDILRVEYRLRF
jgi:hypothetical protein